MAISAVPMQYQLSQCKISYPKAMRYPKSTPDFPQQHDVEAILSDNDKNKRFNIHFSQWVRKQKYIGMLLIWNPELLSAKAGNILPLGSTRNLSSLRVGEGGGLPVSFRSFRFERFLAHISYSNSISAVPRASRSPSNKNEFEESASPSLMG